MKRNANEIYTSLMEIGSVDNLSDEDFLEHIGALIDLSDDLKQAEGIDRAFEWSILLERRDTSNANKALMEYLRANAWATRRKLRVLTREEAWAWEQPERQEEIFCLRRAINHPGFEELPSLRHCQIYTNLANQLNSIGRFVEALEYWDRALSINPKFGMAHGNAGYALIEYAKALYDRGHQALFAKVAHEHLSFSVSQDAQYESLDYKDAQNFFKDRKMAIEASCDLQKISKVISIDNHSMGETEQEILYRNWCLKYRLFLNPLNDLGSYPIAIRDVLLLPAYIVQRNQPPTLIGFFNQLKQEFITARWFLYEGKHSNEAHFADRDVFLYNTLDYPIYSIALEKIKAAYRIVYSIFDKIGFFLNEYMVLNVKPSKVSFRKIWYDNADKDRSKWIIRDSFAKSENWSFRGLFWLSKDLFEEDFTNVTEPDAQALSEIRNHLEHKYLKVHEIVALRMDAKESNTLWTDQLAFSIKRDDLEAKALRLLKLARAALIYLSLGMHREELRRQEGKDNQIAQITLDLLNDNLKR